MAKKKDSKQLVIYQAPSGAIELLGDFKHESVLATLDQIAAVFGRDKSVVSRHLNNIFREGELKRDSVVAKIATTLDILTLLIAESDPKKKGQRVALVTQLLK